MVKYVEGMNRGQVMFATMTLDDYIGKDNICRVIDVFINGLNMAEMGFRYAQTKETGRPPYNPMDMCKLHLYGYLNQVVSSRKLERETQRNIELMWMMRGLTPDDRTISNFMKDNKKVLKKLFVAFRKFCKNMGLYGGELTSIDGTKEKANNSRKHQYSKAGVEKEITYWEKQIERYMETVEQTDREEEGEQSLDRQRVEEILKKMQEKKAHLEGVRGEIEANGGEPICTVDKEAALMKLSGGKGYDVCYNTQTATDGLNGLIIDFNVTSNGSDIGELSDMVGRVQEALGVEEIIIVADTGYSNGAEIGKSEEMGATCLIPKPKPSHQPENEKYRRDQFKYDEEKDSYTCPGGNELHYERTRERDGYKVYGNREACKGCPNREECTKSQAREIERSPYQQQVDQAAERAKNNPELYHRRQELSEHPYGVTKSKWGYNQFHRRGKENATGESAMRYLAFNFRRVLNIMGAEKMIEALTKAAIFVKNRLALAIPESFDAVSFMWGSGARC